SATEAGTPYPSDTLSVHANGAPVLPVLGGPLDHETSVSLSPSLGVTVSDPNGDSLTVAFYGRPVNTTAHPPFSLVDIPDTQHYTAGMFGGSPAIFRAQTRWIVDNTDSLNLAFVNHTGDCVNDGDEVPAEWDSAWTAMSLLEDTSATGLPHGLPYSVSVGNHDQSPNGDPGGTTAGYNRVFGADHFAGRPYYGGHFGSNNDNSFSLFSASGFDFIVVSLEYDMWPDTCGLEWADSLLGAYSTRWAIVSAHCLITLGDPGTFTPQGQATYDALKDNPNLFLMLCGHYHEDARRYDTFEGRTVHTVLADYQMDPNGGDGWLRVMKVYPDENVIRVKTYSPWLDEFEADADSTSQFTLPIDIHPLGGWEFIGSLDDVPVGSNAEVVWPERSPFTEYEWYATVCDGISTTTSPVWRFTTGSEPPVVTVLRPNGGDRLSVGQTSVLEWTAVDDVEVTSVDLLLSRNGAGGPYETLATGIANSGCHDWVIQGPGTQAAFLKVIAYDGDGHATEDSSDAAFMLFDPTGIGADRVTEFGFEMISRNPLRGSGEFSIALPRRASVRVAIYDVAGRQVAVLGDRPYEPGRHRLTWDGSTRHGMASSGVYFVRMEAEDRRFIRKIVLVR
ncbi:MAG: phosphohydrolase, partial [Candidatus Krumholzibacteriota bacterium]|nr:phosphohydrolase [Candidatus Krumholzibacteriota bacterium]